jgi:hypothetical protein
MTLVAELRCKFALDLDPSPSFQRGLGGTSYGKKTRGLSVCG